VTTGPNFSLVQQFTDISNLEAAINDLAVGLIGGDPAHAVDVANAFTGSVTLPSGAVVSFQNTGNPDQGLANLAQAMNLQAQGQAAATAQQCTLNGGRYLNGVCYTCPAGQQVSPVYGPYDAGLQSYPITGYTCVSGTYTTGTAATLATQV